jgi:CDP-diacylglycerol--glycerol-3-phosphate 3-phosphatidyltransferase
MYSNFSANRPALIQLRLRWALFAAFCLLLLVAGGFTLQAAWQPQHAVLWTALASTWTAYVLLVFWRGLPENSRAGESELLPGLGPGNLLTLLRGLLVAGLAGFLFSPRPPGMIAWVPGLLYTLAVLCDYLDGWAARASNHATRLGERLDMSLDGSGVFTAALLAVQYGQVPAWYLVVGLARPAYLAGLWLWRRSGRRVYPLLPAVRRRAFAGVQMGFMAVMLWPIFSPPGTHLAAALFALPFLIGFVRDWLAAAGLFQPSSRPDSRFEFAARWLPVLLRLAAAALLVGSLAPSFFGDPSPSYPSLAPAALLLAVLETAVSILLLLGAAGRAAAILGLILLGIHQVFMPLTAGQIALATLYTALLYLGTGALSVWKPEDHFIYHHAGEKPRKGRLAGWDRGRIGKALIATVLALLVGLALLKAPLREVWAILSGLSLAQLAALILLNLGIFGLFTLRWWLIQRALGYPAPFLAMVRYRLAGFGVTYFTPGPQMGGEPLQVHLVCSRHAVPGAVSVAAVTLDKLLELQSNFAFLVLGVAVILRGALPGAIFPIDAHKGLGYTGPAIQGSGLPGTSLSPWTLAPVIGLVLLPAGYLIALQLRMRPLSRLASWLPVGKRAFSWVLKVKRNAASAEALIARFLKEKPLSLLGALALSLSIWVAMFAEYALSLRFLGLSLDPLGIITMMTAARLAYLLPIPAGAGALEASQVFAAEALGVNPVFAISISLLIRGRDLSLAALGLYLGAARPGLRRVKTISPEVGD